MAEYWGHVGGRAVLKTIAALGFLGAALSQGLANQGFALWVTIGLALSVIGDLCLLAPTSGRAFLTGIGAFLLAHVAYFVGFWTMGIAPLGFGLALVGLAPLAWALHRWLTPDVPERLQRPVMAYILVIIGMVAGAVGAWTHALCRSGPNSWAVPGLRRGRGDAALQVRGLSHQAMGPARLLRRSARVLLAHGMARVMH